MQKQTIDANAWNATHAVSIQVGIDGLKLFDNVDDTWHVMSISDPLYAGKMVHLKLIASPIQDGDTWLYINHWGGVDIGYISRAAEVSRGRCEVLNAIRLPDGRFCIDVSYFLSSSAGTVYIGTAKQPGEARYSGSGAAQWTIHSVSIAPEPIVMASLDERLVMVDVGAAGGVDERWLAEKDKIHFVLIEPQAEQAAILRAEMKYPSVEIIESALFNVSGSRELYLTRFDQCSSLLEPDFDVLSRYRVSPCFEVIGKATVACRRYDEIPQAPAPDMIKIDAQGVEYEVLEGFGKYLDSVLALELEVHFYPIYKRQKLLFDLIPMLAKHGLRLRSISPQTNFDRDLVEANAYFTRETPISSAASEKLEIIHRILNLSDNDGGKGLSDGLSLARVPAADTVPPANRAPH